MSKEGSRNVSLGPYRSAELALEDRLTRKEAKDLAIDTKYCSFGRATIPEGGSENLVKILKNLGYKQESECLYTRRGFVGNGMLFEDRFVFVSSTPNELAVIVSGNYDGNSSKVLADINIFEEMKVFYSKSKSNPDSLLHGSLIIPSFIGLTGISSLVSSLYNIQAELVFASAASLIIGIGFGCYSRFQRKFINKAMGLSANARGYLYGNPAYEQIMSEHFSLTLPDNKPKQLKSSEIKQLPEPKTIVEELPADNEQTSNIPEEIRMDLDGFRITQGIGIP